MFGAPANGRTVALLNGSDSLWVDLKKRLRATEVIMKHDRGKGLEFREEAKA